MIFDDWWATTKAAATPETFLGWEKSCRQAWRAAQIAERARYCTALRIAREGYASEAATGLPVLPQWRERVIALIDEALGPDAPPKPHPDSCGCRACDVARNQGIFPMRGL